MSGREAARTASFAARVVAWQRRHGRHDLPWQAPRDPYRVWLSEVMLQQTQVATVRPYFERFVARFPDLASLAAAPLDDVLALWSGLGYYSRARHLHRCAQLVVAQHGGSLPRGRDALAALPGIGRSTAAAIGALGHGERAAILDGNVKRVLARHLGFDGDLALPAAQRELWQRAEALLPASRQMAAYTQGLMDLGALVCLAREPRCGACPLRGDCSARRSGRIAELPRKSRRTRRGVRSHALLVLRWRDEVVLVRRPERGVWAGLWSLPEFDDVDALRGALAGTPGAARHLAPMEHALTHFDWRLQPVRWALPARSGVRARAAALERAPGARWFSLADALRMSLPAPVRRLLDGEATPSPAGRERDG